MTDNQTEVEKTDQVPQTSDVHNPQPEQNGNVTPDETAETNPARFDTDDRAERAAGEMTGEETGILEAVPGNQDDLPPSASPPAFSTVDATADVDAVIDRDGNDDDLEAIVGLNSPIRGDVGPPSDAAPPPAKDEHAAALANDLPIADYDDLSVAEVGRKLPDLSDDQIHQIERYEKSHRKRKTLLAKLERRLHNEQPNKRSGGKKHAHEVGHTDDSRA